MSVSNFLSLKLRIISFIGIFYVLFIHSTILNVESFLFFSYTQAFLRTIWNSFFPLFFSISGYLFFLGFDGSKEQFVKKFKSRIKSLIIPYIIWNLLFIFTMLTLKYFPLSKGVINSDFSNLFTTNFSKLFHAIFIKPIGFHLWFIRDLIGLVIFSPIVWIILNKINWVFICILIIIKLIFIDEIWIDSLVPFVIGSLLAINKINIEHKISKISLIGLLILTILFGLLICSNLLKLESLIFYFAWIPFLLLWFGYDFVYQNQIIKKITNSRIVTFTFFIYVFHEPYLNISKKIILFFGNKNELSIWISYFTAPLITIIMAIYVAKLINLFSPKIYNTLVGGR